MTDASIVVVCTLLIVASNAHAQEPAEAQEDSASRADELSGPAQSSTDPPTEVPPAPPELPPPPPQGEAEAEEQMPAPVTDGTRASGQWVYTSYLGWVFVPYGDQYVSSATAPDDAPFAYVYLPGAGWLWQAAPWVWGVEPYPFGVIVQPLQVGWHPGPGRGGRGARGSHWPSGGHAGPNGGPPRSVRPGPARPGPAHPGSARPGSSGSPRDNPVRRVPASSSTGHLVGAPGPQGNFGRQVGAAAGAHATEHHR
jgi:hypothetical protein